MTKKILNTWKEIAQYVGCNVRTCQRWEKELGFPVRRLANYPHSRVFAIEEEIDVWMENNLNRKIKGNKSLFTLIKHKSKVISIILFSTVAIISSAVIMSLFPFSKPQPYDFMLNGSVLSVLDNEQKILWSHDTKIDDLESEQHYRNHFQDRTIFEGIHHLPLIAFRSLDMSSHKYTLFIIEPLLSLSKRGIICLSSKDKVDWSFQLSDIIPRECMEMHSLLGFDVEDLNNDGKQEIVLLDSPIPDCQSHAVVLDCKGKNLGYYRHPGHLTYYVSLDIDNDGIKEIILCGNYFSAGIPCCAVLDYTGDNTNAKHRVVNENEWKVKYLITFPTFNSDDIHIENTTVQDIELRNDNDSETTISFNGIITYELNTDLELTNIILSGRFKQIYNRYVKEGTVEESQEIQKNRMIQEGLSYHTGTQWSKKISMIQNWQLK